MSEPGGTQPWFVSRLMIARQGTARVSQKLDQVTGEHIGDVKLGEMAALIGGREDYTL